ncbi:MAG: NAD(P)H-dependent oxidoreductase subunit E, partial [Pseudomonadota bacterium]
MKEGEAFSFNEENLAEAKKIVAHYPEGRQASAVLPLLDLAQKQAGGWLSTDVMNYIADYLGMPYIRVYEVASFYDMYNTKPIGKVQVRACTTTPCWL